MPVIGEPSHPQALFMGFQPDDPGYLAMVQLVAASRLIEPDGLTGIRAVEWDILVVTGDVADLSGIPGHMHVLALGCARPGLVRSAAGWVSVAYSPTQPSPTLTVAGDLPDPLRAARHAGARALAASPAHEAVPRRWRKPLAWTRGR